MKHIIISIFLVVCFFGAGAQSKLIVTMILQVVANQAHIAEIEQGFKIAGSGLNFISNAKKGELDLHRLFFSSLLQINPAIKKWVNATGIITIQLQLINNYKAHLKQLQSAGQFTPAEIRYIKNVFTKLLTHNSQDMDELITLVSPGNYQMTDDERIQGINILHASIQSDYDFEQSFGTQTLILGMQRQKEFTDAKVSKQLNGLQ